MYLEEIKAGIAKNGFHEIHWLALSNDFFSANHSEGKSKEKQLEDFCKHHGFSYEVIEVHAEKKKVHQMVRFSMLR